MSAYEIYSQLARSRGYVHISLQIRHANCCLCHFYANRIHYQITLLGIGHLASSYDAHHLLIYDNLTTTSLTITVANVSVLSPFENHSLGYNDELHPVDRCKDGRLNALHTGSSSGRYP